MANFLLSRKKKHLFFAATKLQVDHITKKTVANFDRPLFIPESVILKSQNDHKLLSKKLNTSIGNCLGIGLPLSFNLN